jgi:hypothetical protein
MQSYPDCVCGAPDAVLDLVGERFGRPDRCTALGWHSQLAQKVHDCVGMAVDGYGQTT